MSRTLRNSFILLLTTISISVGMEANERLYRNLFSDYLTSMMPMARNTTNNTTVPVPVTVRIRPAFYSLIDVDEAKETITYSIWHSIKWVDKRLVWDPSEYEGVDTLTVDRYDIWVPDIKCYEIIGETNSGMLPYYAQINYTGGVQFGYPILLTAYCQLNIRNFPFDVQNCSLKFTSWMYGGDKLRLKTQEGIGESAIANYQDNPEWDLHGIEHEEVTTVYTTSGVPLTYYEVHFHVVIGRRPGYYLITLVLPCFLIVTISIIGLFSPNVATLERSERVTLGLTALLTIAIVLMMVADLMPKGAVDVFPLIGSELNCQLHRMYMLYEMILTTLGTVAAAVIMYMERFLIFSRRVLNCHWTTANLRMISYNFSQAVFLRWPPNCLYTVLLLRKLRGQKSNFLRSVEKRDRNNKQSVHQQNGSQNINMKTQKSDSTNLNTDNDTLSALHKILDAIKTTKYFSSDDEENERKCENLLKSHWVQICFRLDLLCLSVFMLINFVLTAYYAGPFKSLEG